MSGSRSILEDFFDAENRRDWEAYAGCLDPQVEWTVGGRTVRGRDAYVAAIRAAYERAGAVSFRLHQVLESEDKRVVATLLVDSTGARSLDVFELADGLVRREWEFELGPGPDWNGKVTRGV